MARPLSVDWHETVSQLARLYKAEKEPQTRSRLQALYLLRQGYTLEAVGDIVGVRSRTVQRWVAWYRQGGVAQVRQHHQGGHAPRPRWLSPQQEAGLRAASAAGEIDSIKAGQAWVEATYGIRYSYWGMRTVFDRLGLTKKVPRPQAPQASPQVQDAWKKGG